MRSPAECDTIQVEWTNHCVLACGNCTRMIGHSYKPEHLSFEIFKTAIDSLVEYTEQTGLHMVGAMGGEPLLHPEFERFCDYAVSMIDRSRLGLWSTFPKGFERYREVICRTFGNLLLNDHTLEMIEHAPLLVAAKDVIDDEAEMWRVIDQCWIQNSWSAAINKNGAYFCEVAAARDLLFQTNVAWPVVPGWWKRIPMHFKEQMEAHCPGCGGALSLPRRHSQDERDDVSLSNVDLLKGKSRRIDRGQYVLWDKKLRDFRPGPYPPQEYKKENYRRSLAARYGIRIELNQHRYWDPQLDYRWDPNAPEREREPVIAILERRSS